MTRGTNKTQYLLRGESTIVFLNHISPKNALSTKLTSDIVLTTSWNYKNLLHGRSVASRAWNAVKEAIGRLDIPSKFGIYVSRR